jgi:hypothetical protein
MKFETQLTGSTPLQLCVCLIPGPRFLYAYVVNLFVFNSLMWEVIVSCVAIEEISPSVFSWKKEFINKNYEYDAILSKYDSAEKRYINYAYVSKNGVGRFNIFF